MSKSAIQDIFLASPPPPCEVHNCRLAALCAKHCLACDAFGEYVTDGTNHMPPKRPCISKFWRLFPTAPASDMDLYAKAVSVAIRGLGGRLAGRAVLHRLASLAGYSVLETAILWSEAKIYPRNGRRI